MTHARGLKLVGYAYGGVVAAIGLIALVVVTAHVNTPVAASPDRVHVSVR